MGMGKLTYVQADSKESNYWMEVVRSLFDNKIDVEKIDYGKENALYVYDPVYSDFNSLESKWEYSIIQQLMPLPIK